jgi:hypothetical protein
VHNLQNCFQFSKEMIKQLLLLFPPPRAKKAVLLLTARRCIVAAATIAITCHHCHYLPPLPLLVNDTHS